MDKILIIALGLMVAASPSLSEALRCDIREKYYCMVREGCNPIIPTTFMRIDASQRAYSRCDKNTCNSYKAIFRESGSYIDIEVLERALLGKLDTASSEFFEVVTLGLDAYLSFGHCRVEN